MELQVFENSEHGRVRTLLDEDGTVLFCGSDVAKALGYSKPQNLSLIHISPLTAMVRLQTHRRSSPMAPIPSKRAIAGGKSPVSKSVIFMSWHG